METPGIVIPTHEREIDNTFVKSSSASGMRFLRENYSYIFEGPEGSTESFLISTWPKKVHWSVVRKHGTLQDIVKLVPPYPKDKPRRSYMQLPGVRRKKARLLGGGMIDRQWSRRSGRISRGATALRGHQRHD